jgi:hypothetical protein
MKLLIPFLLFPLVVVAQLKSPDQFLSTPLGVQFTYHHELVAYVEHVAANSDRVKLVPYGKTAQGRPLLVVVISSPENIKQLEAIRLNNLKRAGLVDGSVDAALDRAIVGLGFSVHGNEAAGIESSMNVLYTLANPENTTSGAWLKQTVVLLDPIMNPDGNARYVNWYRDISPAIPDPNPAAREHREPWPGGRPNHYLFDLNRDWAWQTQPESRQRAVFYQQWLPHIFADIHEQGYNEPYYFAPAARPHHAYITDWQHQFQATVGDNHARYFNKEGWLFFTRERFDLLYPSYGDTYPTYLGSIGMTYEQGGIGAGRAILIENGDTLTLADRIRHHQTTALSTVEIAAQHVPALLDNFKAFYERSMKNPPGAYKTYIIKGSNPTAKLASITDLLRRNGIRYGKAGKNATFKGFDYHQGIETTVQVEEEDLLISAYQPFGTLAQVLLEPQVWLQDSVTYDITAWALPYAHGLTAFALKERLDVRGEFHSAKAAAKTTMAETPYAYLVRWQSLEDARFLSALSQAGIQVRYAKLPFAIENKDYQAGTLVITRADNRLVLSNFDAIVTSTAARFQVDVRAVQGGMVQRGADFGSSDLVMTTPARIAVLSGEGTYANSYGQVWHYLEQDLKVPFSSFPAGSLGQLNLEDFRVLIMPEGNYRLDEQTIEHLQRWISRGGKLIAIGSAVSSLYDKKGFSVRGATGKDHTVEWQAADLPSYGDQERERISYDIPGAIVGVKMDNTHPLGFGFGAVYHSLRTSTQAAALMKNGWNVGALTSDYRYTGFIGAKARESIKNTMVYGVEDIGRGSVVYLIDNPLFRGFWEQGKLLFSNALFFVGQ